MSIPKVLIVEDNKLLLESWQERLIGIVEIIPAYTLREGSYNFNKNQDVSVIAMDACVPGNSVNTVTLVTAIRRAGYKGPMIAISGIPNNRQRLIEAGCDYECQKEEVVKKVQELLGY